MAASLRKFSGFTFQTLIKHKIIGQYQGFPHVVLKASFSHTPVSHGVLDNLKKLNPFHRGKDTETGTQKYGEDKRPESFETLLNEIIQEGEGTLGVNKLKDRAEIKDHIYRVLKNHVKIPEEVDDGNWMDVKLDDQTLKFAILRDCMMVTGRVIPNLELNNMKTISDVVKFYLGEEKKDARIGHPVAEWFIANKYKFPPNMTFIPYVKEVGVRRRDRTKKQKLPKKVKEKLAKEKLRRKERLAERRKLKF